MKLGEGCASPRQGSSGNHAQLECKHCDCIEKNKREKESKVRRGRKFRRLKRCGCCVPIITGSFSICSLLLSNTDAIITAG